MPKVKINDLYLQQKIDPFGNKLSTKLRNTDKSSMRVDQSLIVPKTHHTNPQHSPTRPPCTSQFPYFPIAKNKGNFS